MKHLALIVSILTLPVAADAQQDGTVKYPALQQEKNGECLPIVAGDFASAFAARTAKSDGDLTAQEKPDENPALSSLSGASEPSSDDDSKGDSSGSDAGDKDVFASDGGLGTTRVAR